MKKILLIDNYDSFTYTLVFYFKELGFAVRVVKNDAFKNAKALENWDFSHLIISPGPNAPSESKLSLKAIRHFKKSKKILGICLGHQAIAQVFGGTVERLPAPRHAKVSPVFFKKDKIFKGLKNGFEACLYHSLHVKNCPKSLKILAHDKNGVVMALRHKKYPIYGLQFHPEAILSEGGKKILSNFMKG